MTTVAQLPDLAETRQEGKVLMWDEDPCPHCGCSARHLLGRATLATYCLGCSNVCQEAPTL